MLLLMMLKQMLKLLLRMTKVMKLMSQPLRRRDASRTDVPRVSSRRVLAITSSFLPLLVVVGYVLSSMLDGDVLLRSRSKGNLPRDDDAVPFERRLVRKRRT